MNENFIVKLLIDINYDSETLDKRPFNTRKYYATVKYSAIFELRDWGIKSILFLVPDQEITFVAELDSLTDEEPDYIEFNIKLTDITVSNENDLAKDGCFSPKSLDLTLSDLKMNSNGEAHGKATGVFYFNSV